MLLTVNGTPFQVEGGATLLEALDSVGVALPRLCHDARLAPAAVCRMCLVEVEGQPRPVPACATRAEDGMSVATHTPALEDGRRMVLAMLAATQPRDAVARFREHPFQRLLAAYGLEDAVATRPQVSTADCTHPYLRVDVARCITCLRCVRICADVQGQFVWSTVGRGHHTRIAPDSGSTFAESACVSCGACVDTCPTGALEDKTVVERGAPEELTVTTCPYCGVGCQLRVGTRGGRIVTSRPVNEAPSSKGHLCSKGRYAWGFVEAPDRLTTPLVRDGGVLRTARWEEALGVVAAGLKRVLASRGPGAVGVLGSSRATNEDNYVAQKLARVVLGTNNVDCCARVCHAPSAAALAAMLGTGAATSCYDDIELARTLVVVGSDATECHPVIGARLKQAKRRGAFLVVVDPRRTELAEWADLHLAVRPGTNVPLLLGLANVILTEGAWDRAFVQARVDGLDALRAAAAEWTPERTAQVTSVPAADLVAAARRYATFGPTLAFHGLGLTEHAQGTDGVSGLVNLALLTGNVGKPGAGVNPLRGQNNVQGSAHMGCEPGRLTGYVKLDEGRARFERVWRAPVPKAKGLDWMEMVDAAVAGELKALWVMGYDVLVSNPDMAATERALENLELLVVQDLFLTETARDYATVVLPASSSFEKDGTFMSAERRVQRVRRAVAPPGDARADWEIVCAVAKALGHAEGFEFASPKEIWDEVRAVWPAGAGLGWERLDDGGLQWPCPSADHPGTKRLHEAGFSHGPRARLAALRYEPSAELAVDELPFVLVTGRTLHGFNAGTMTGRTPHAVLRPRDVLDIAAEDATRLGLREGDEVTVRSRHGACRLPIHVSAAQRPGEVFASFQTPEARVNLVTGPQRDGATHTPAYKVTAVRIER